MGSYIQAMLEPHSQIIDIYSTNQILQSDMQFESTGWKKLPFFSDGSKEFQQLKDTRIAKATKQYVFDEQGVKYLDFQRSRSCGPLSSSGCRSGQHTNGKSGYI